VSGPPDDPLVSGAPSAGAQRRRRAHPLVRAGLHTSVFTVLTLASNLVAGIVTARALAPDGRGEAVAIAVLAQTVGFFFACGGVHAVSYRRATEPASASRLLTTWAVMLLPLFVVAVVAGELALPAFFSAQSDEAIALARVYLLTISLVLLAELTNGMLLGAEDFLFLNAARFAQPALMAIVQTVLWRLEALTVETSLLTAAVTSTMVQGVALMRIVRRSGGFGPFDRKLGLETLWYGFRGHGVGLAGSLNQRLDLLILPAFLAATSVGLYSIAANVSLIIFAVANNFAGMVLPAAAKDATKNSATVLGSLQATLVAAGALAVGLGLVARPALELVYGQEFGAAAPALQILLPGTVMLAGSSILTAGLYAANRPTAATLTQIVGLVVTIVGLLLFVPVGGMTAAAIVSTAAYGAVFVAALITYKRVAGLRWGRFLAAPAGLRPARQSR